MNAFSNKYNLNGKIVSGSDINWTGKTKGLRDIAKDTGLISSGKDVAPDVSATDPAVDAKLSEIIAGGGLGMGNDEMNSYRQMWEGQLEPRVRAAQLESDQEATRRGVYDSPVAVASRGMARESGNKKLAELWQQLMLSNAEAKRNSLLSAMSMKQAGAASAAQLELAQYQIEQQRKAANQANYMALLEVGLDKIL
jgi:hypothetical protein